MHENNQQLPAELQEPHFATIFRSSPLGICITTLEEGTFLDANPAFLKTENLKLESILGRTSLDLGYWRDPLERQRVVQILKETGSITNCEMSHRLKDGTINHSLRSLERITLDGRDCILTMLTDITDRQAAEQALRASEERFSKAFRSSPDAISLIGLPEGRVIDVNDRFIELSGHNREDVIGRTTLELGFWNDPALRDRFYKMLREQGAVSGLDATLLTKSGELCEVQLSSILFELDGRSCMMTSSRNVTAQKRAEKALHASEQRYRALIEHSFDAIALIDQNGALLYGSPAATRITGRTADEWIGQGAFERIHPDDVPLARGLFAKLLENPTLIQQSQFRYLHKDESWIWLEVTATNLLKQPAIQAIVINYRDITERKHAEMSIRESQQSLENIVNTVDGIVWESDARTFQFSFVSQQAERMLGYPRQRWTTEPTFWKDHIHPQDRNAAVDFCMNETRQGKSHQFEYRMLSADGREIWLKDFVSVVLQDGVPVKLLGIMVDITEHKHAEAALHESNERFLLVAKATNDAVWDWNITADVGWWNDGVYALFGYRREQVPIEEIVWNEHLHPDDRDRVLFGIRAVIDGRSQSWSDEYRIICADGSVGFVYDRGFVLRDSTGKAYRMIGAAQNITARKQAEAALIAERQLLRTMADNLPADVFVKDTAGRYLFVNLTRMRQLGLSCDAEVLGKTVFDIFPADIARSFDLDDQSVIQTGLPVIEREEPFEIHGNLGWFLTTKVPLRDAQGTITGLVGIALDITSRKQAEAALIEERNLLRTLVDHIPDFIFVKDTQSRQLLNNAANLRLIGAKTDAEVAGKTVFDIYPREQAQRYFDEDQRVMRSGQEQLNQEESVLDQDGREYWLLSSKVPLRDVHGKCIGLVGIKRDITEHKRDITELAASRERLEILSRQLIATQETERRHLARELHDEIGQALTGIKLNLKALQQPTQTARSGTLVQDTIAVVDQTLRRVRSLALDLRPSMLDEIGLVAALRWCLDRQSQRAGFAPQFVADSSVSGASPEINTACFRIMQESLTNIGRHANARHVRVELRQDDQELELLVRDDGIGFDVAAARNRNAQGESLGLLGMEERVQLIGGQIEIVSVPAQGTTIRVRIPLANESS